MESVRELTFSLFPFSRVWCIGVYIHVSHARGVLRLMLKTSNCSSILITGAGSFSLPQSSLIWLVLLESVFWGVPSQLSETGSTGRPPLPRGISPGFWGLGTPVLTSRLRSKHFNHRVISPALEGGFINQGTTLPDLACAKTVLW